MNPRLKLTFAKKVCHASNMSNVRSVEHISAFLQPPPPLPLTLTFAETINFGNERFFFLCLQWSSATGVCIHLVVLFRRLTWIVLYVRKIMAPFSILVVSQTSNHYMESSVCIVYFNAYVNVMILCTC